MDRKILILLFAVVFYNGVTYSSPVDGQQILDGKLPEQKQPTADHINKKIESTVVPSVQPIPISHNGTVPHPVNPVQTVKNETIHPVNSSIPQPVIKNVTQDAKKNSTQVVVVDTKNLNTTVVTNSSLPVENVTVPSVIPSGKIVTDMPQPPLSGQTTTVSSTAAVTVNETVNQTTTMAPSTTTLKTTTAVSPTPTSKESVIIEHNVPAPAEEKHFNGPSFIGGIVLTIGLTAIGFIAFKYYKSGKIDMNYRTL